MIACALVSGERSVGELQGDLGIGQPGLSQQLAQLREAGLIEGRRQSRSVLYHLADERVAAIVTLLYQMFCAAPPPAKASAAAARRRGPLPARRPAR